MACVSIGGTSKHVRQCTMYIKLVLVLRAIASEMPLNFTHIGNVTPEVDLRARHACGDAWYSFWIGGLGTSLLCSFAIFGNLTCIAVLARPAMRSSINCILLALSCSDLFHVVTCLLLRGIQRTLQHYCTGLGYTHSFQPLAMPYIFPIGTTAQLTSIYLTVLVSLERYLAVCWPFRARVWCTSRRSSLSSAVILTFSVFYNLPTWWELETVRRVRPIPYGDPDFAAYEPRYTPLANHPNYVYYYVNFGSFIVFRVIPFTLLVVLNMLIYRQIRRMNQTRQNLTRSQAQDCSVARMLFCIVLIFFLGNVPTAVGHMLRAFDVERPPELISVSNFLILLNAASYFVIYSFLSTRFRAELWEMIGSLWGSKGRAERREEETRVQPRTQFKLNAESRY